MDINQHPCFNGESKHRYGRVHLPVAPKCNIQCNFCNKQYDCVSESRPGVTSAVLTPHQAMAYLNDVTKEKDNIKVVGIAGPGDPFANANETIETLRLVREKYPDMLLCVASNGLEITPWIDELVELNVSHVTVTVNAVNVDVATKLYSWVRYGKKMYRGTQAAKLLLEKQHMALSRLAKTRVILKVNTVVVPGINDSHLDEIGNELLHMGIDMQNCIPFHPVVNTPFENIEEPNPFDMKRIRLKAAGYVEQMSHCQRCRADAAGMLAEKCGGAAPDLSKYTKMNIRPSEQRPYIAAVSQEGVLVNQHLGDAEMFLVYKHINNNEIELVESREAPPPGGGNERWEEVSRILNDCSDLFVGDAGPRPSSVLNENGIRVWRVDGLIQDVARAAFEGEQLSVFEKTNKFTCGTGCSGKGTGCL